MNSEKRIFAVKELNDDRKKDYRYKFVGYLKKNIDKRIDNRDVFESETNDMWSLLYCDGVRIYRSIFVKGDAKIENNKYSSVERKAIINLFIKLASALLKEEVKYENVIEDENDEQYVLTYRYDGDNARTFSLEYKKNDLKGMFDTQQ